MGGGGGGGEACQQVHRSHGRWSSTFGREQKGLFFFFVIVVCLGTPEDTRPIRQPLDMIQTRRPFLYTPAMDAKVGPHTVQIPGDGRCPQFGHDHVKGRRRRHPTRSTALVDVEDRMSHHQPLEHMQQPSTQFRFIVPTILERVGSGLHQM